MLSGPAQGGEVREKSSVMAIARNRQIERDGEPALADAVIVEIILEAVVAIGQGCDMRAHHRLGAVGQRIERGEHRFITIIIQQRGETAPPRAPTR